MLSVLMFLTSCTNNNSTASDENTAQVTEEEAPQSKTEIQELETPTKAETEPEITQEEKTNTVTAKFVEFVLGDASHFKFEDESGKMWDFGGCESKNFTFEKELEESASNTDNQGWGSNKELQEKWFILSYDQREEPLYIDGPIGMVNIITEAKLK